MQDDNEMPAGDLEAALTKKYTESVSKLIHIQTDTTTKIIEAVREYLATLPREEESPDPAQKAASDERILLAYGKLMDSSRELGPLGQLQSLNMLAVVVQRFSDESGRSVAEILEQLGTMFADFGDFESLVQDVTRESRDE